MGISHRPSYISLSLLSQGPADLALSVLQPKLQASVLQRNVVKPRDEIGSPATHSLFFAAFCTLTINSFIIMSGFL